MDPAKALTLLFVLLILAVIAVKFWMANRRAGRLAAEAARREKERAEKERELLERLGRLRKKDDLAAAASAIDKDPERAARVVARMMKDKTGTQNNG